MSATSKLKISNLKPGNNIVLKKPIPRVAIVIKQENELATIVYVKRATNNTRCYDEGGSSKSTDEHKVRLRGCDSIYKSVLDWPKNAYYALAGPSDQTVINEDFLDEHGAHPIPNGRLVPEPVLAQLLNHPWWDEREKEKLPPPVIHELPTEPSEVDSPNKDDPEIH